VRISSSLASAGWANLLYIFNTGTPGEHEVASFYAAIGLKPTVELRMTF
jgi:hypothetical protein